MEKTVDIKNAEWQTVAADVVLVDAPLWWHKQGLQQTATGYGRKLTTAYKVPFNGRLYRVYACCFSNAATLFFDAAGQRYTLN